MLGNWMPQKRNPENKGFPPRWRVLHGAIFYRVPKGLEAQWDGKKLFRLGKTPGEAYRTWADRTERQVESKTISQLLDRYTLEVIPTKEPGTQRNNIFEMKQLRVVFGDMALADLEPKDVYAFVDKRTAKVTARREVALLSHAFTKAVEWGYISRHPFKGEVRLKGERSRKRYVEDWEIDESMALEPFRKAGSVLVIQAYMLIKLLIGQRQNDMLMIKLTELKDDGIHITPSKTSNTTGVKLIIKWSDALRAAVKLALEARPVDISPWLFCNESGQCYYNPNTGLAPGWRSMWTRFMDRVIDETKVTERFTDKDLRAKAGSEAKSLELAQKLLGHSSSAITGRVYRRKPEVVEPTK
jgi:integrase